jgi:hypothetical protein
MTDPLEKFRQTLEQAYYHACEIPEFKERGIDKLILRVLNQATDALTAKIEVLDAE